ncbi:alpha/beta hydrolase-fold protein [Pseudorhodoferax sp. LjRoot39]|uniref:alpha/beta hydrolase n=1 Tax=Pseudorhodoferax sp. LjRoot39 TaxID=3342328 RepID=UPI003ECCC82A
MSAGHWSAVELPRAQTRRWLAQANGQRYRISVWLPSGTPPPGGFPAVYVLDANALFATFVELAQRSGRRPDATGIQPMAVVGIAHDGDSLYDDALRRRDFTFGPPAGEPAPAAGTVGGGPALLSFLADELGPALRAEFPLDAARQTLFGHSLAGHFALRALAARPDAFRCWAAISPSVWWDEAGLRAALAATLPGRTGLRVLLAVGEWEKEIPPWQRSQPGHADLVARRARRDMVGGAQALAADLRTWLGDAQAVFRLFPDEDHASVVLVAAQRSLRLACS